VINFWDFFDYIEYYTMWKE